MKSTMRKETRRLDNLASRRVSIVMDDLRITQVCVLPPILRDRPGSVPNIKEAVGARNASVAPHLGNQHTRQDEPGAEPLPVVESMVEEDVGEQGSEDRFEGEDQRGPVGGRE